MSYNVGEADVTIVPNASRFNEELAAKLLPAAAETGRKMGDEIADGIRERLALIGDVHIGVETGRASAEVDKFLAETDAKAEVAGKVAGEKLGNNLSKSAANSARGGSPLIMAAVAGGLLAGGPLLIGAAGVVFGGLAALILHNQNNVANAASQMASQVTTEYTKVAQVAAPYLVLALNEVRDAAAAMAPAVGGIFKNLQPAIQGVTQGVIDLAQNAMPGLAAAVKTSAPVFDGLHVLLADIGTGLGNMFTLISQHAPAMGQVLSSLGGIMDSLLTGIGSLLVAGGELGSIVLPPLAAALSAVADVLHVLEPILPGVALAFGAWKVAGIIAPMLGSLAGALDTIGIKALIAVDGLTLSAAAGDAAAAGFGAAATGARGLEAAMGPIGWIIAGVSLLIPLLLGQSDAQKQVAASADDMTAALQQSKGAIDQNVRASAAMSAQKTGLLDWANTIGVTGPTVVNALLGNKNAMDQVAAASARYDATQNAIATAGYKAATGINASGVAAGTTQIAVDKATQANRDHMAALAKLAGVVQTQVKNEHDLAAAIAGSNDASDINRVRLESLSTAASAAQTQINLLKGALDALTGKSITMDQAQIAVTQAVLAASTALKNQKGALVDANGHLDLYTAKGAAAAQALINLAGTQHNEIATMEQQGRSTSEVSKKSDELRLQFISTAQQMGFNAAEAKTLADRYFGIPKNVHTEIAADTGGALSNVNALLTAIARLRDKSITITTVTQGFHVSGGQGTVGGTTLAGAIGGIVHPFAGGGIEPMQGGIAQVVPPGTLRVIGDRVKDDEAYIPINRDLRSIAIWRQAGERMGQLAAAGSRTGGSSGGGGPSSFTGNLYLDSGEFLGKVRGVAESAVVDYSTSRDNASRYS